MKLATLKSMNSLDGSLVVVSRNLENFVDVSDIAPNLLHALEHWNSCEPRLRQRYAWALRPAAAIRIRKIETHLCILNRI